ncbi:protein of unknown function [bacterium A37T11]|nr:protein of unknown function [bacterium A37T11]
MNHFIDRKMKIMLRYVMMLLAATSLYSCQKDGVDQPDFEVNTSTLSYQVGDTVQFNFSGNPNFITFYSGEPGYRYEYRDRTSASGTPTLQFTSALNAGSQANTLHLLVSTDFSGVTISDTVATAAAITAATWTDITSRATLATSGTAVTSGIIDLSDISAGGKPVYIAFKYTAASGSVQNKWTISALTVTNTLADGTAYTIANLNYSTSAITSNFAGVSTFSPGWVGIPVKNTLNWVITGGTSLVITGAATADLATSDTETWTLMGPLDLQKVTPEVGIAVKSANAVVNSYSYTFKSAGTFSAKFVAYNENVSAREEKTKEFNIVVK